jgi:hypothetical protein
MRRFGMVALLALGLAAMTGPANAKVNCDRKCLGGKLDQFLTAVIAKDPSKANLWVGFRQTQNAVLTAPGEGIWKTNTGLGSLDRRYVDPDTQQAEFYGTIKEGDATAIASLRIRLHGEQVGEAEWQIARSTDPDITGAKGRGVFDIDNLLKNPPPQRVVPKGERHARDELVAAVNSYFDGITAGTGRHVQANPGCYRLENGLGGPQWASRPVPKADQDFESQTDCRTGYGGLGIVNVAARRYLMVDEEAQVVVASAVFIREPLSPKRRNCFMEIFFLDGGKISEVYAAMVYADPKQPMPNWAPYDGNFPIGQNLVLHQ